MADLLATLSGLESRFQEVALPGGPLRMHVRVSRAVPAHTLPVVLVHGLAVSSRYFVPTAAWLAPHYRVYAPDLPGWGRSDKPAHVLDIDGLAGALVAWMDAAGIQRAALVGNSMGCQIIARAAVRHPARLTHAVLIGPTMDRRGRNAAVQGVRLMRDMVDEPPWSWAIHARDLIDFGVWRMLVTLRHALRHPIEADLPHMRVPALVVRGDRDPIVPQRWAEEVARRLPDSRLAVIPGVAHAVNTSSPRALVAVVEPFLSETRATRPPAVPTGSAAPPR